LSDYSIFATGLQIEFLQYVLPNNPGPNPFTVFQN